MRVTGRCGESGRTAGAVLLTLLLFTLPSSFTLYALLELKANGERVFNPVPAKGKRILQSAYRIAFFINRFHYANPSPSLTGKRFPSLLIHPRVSAITSPKSSEANACCFASRAPCSRERVKRQSSRRAADSTLC